MELVVTLLVAGAILLLAETVLPGMIAGILGALCLLAGIVAAYVEFGVRTGNAVLIGVSVLMIGGFLAWVKFFPESKFGRVFISQGAVGDIRADQPQLLHRTGVAFTQLRPSGTALIDGRRVDVVTEGGLIEKGAPLKVVAIEGMRVVVRAQPQTPSANSPSTSQPQPTKTA